MENVIVEEIIDGDTLKVNRWRMTGANNYYGKIVKILGYHKKDGKNDKVTTAKLNVLLKNRRVALTRAKKVKLNKEKAEDNVVYCSVYLNGVDVKEYFPELR